MYLRGLAAVFLVLAFAAAAISAPVRGQELPTVTITAGDPHGAEGGPDTATFTVARSGDTTHAVSVAYSTAGTASSGSDFTALSGTVTIAPGASTASITVTPIDDGLAEESETVVVTLTGGAAYISGSPDSATVTLADDDLPMVFISATDPIGGEVGPDTGTLMVSRTGATATSLLVTYSVGGSATPGADYLSLSGSVTIPAGANSTNITLTPLDDGAAEGSETVVLTLSSSVGYGVSASAGVATVTINDDDLPVGLPVVTISPTDGNANEAGSDSGLFTVSRGGGTAGPLTVNYMVGGSASGGSDYAELPGTATIDAGASSATITVTVLDDSLVEGTETVVVSLAAGAAYTVGVPDSAAIVIADNDVPPGFPTVTVLATDPEAAESGLQTGSFTVARTGDATGELTISYSVGGTATAGSDYAALSGTITIPAGSSTASIAVVPVDDAAVEEPETVTVTLAAAPAYTVGADSTATVTITSDDTTAGAPVVSVAAGDPDAAEEGPNNGTFTITRTGSTAGSLTVVYTVGGTATAGSDYAALSGALTIPAGSSSASITVIPLHDMVEESPETVVVTLTAGDAYTLGSPSVATVVIQDAAVVPTPDDGDGDGDGDAGDRPGWGCGDRNHHHTGPPGRVSGESPCAKANGAGQQRPGHTGGGNRKGR